jgi:hypothetical protein
MLGQGDAIPEGLISMQSALMRPATLAASLIVVLVFSSTLRAEKTLAKKTFRFAVHDKKTIRKIPTTQVSIRVEQWPEQTFLLWLPEAVTPFWGNWKAGMTGEQFIKTSAGGLRWEYADRSQARIVAELVPRAESLLLEVRVKNLTAKDIEQVAVQHCLHLSSAADFACDDFSRVHVRSDGRWRTLRQLAPTVNLPMYYRTGFLESGRRDSWGGEFRNYNQKTRVDHPLMVCTSKDGQRGIGTASENFQCVFHNQLTYLRCIHSQQAPVPNLPAGAEAVFRQVIYFVDGGVSDCVSAFQKDLKEGGFRPSHD